MKYDLIVVGAGTAGCTVAKVVGDKGYSVALIDMKKREDIGNKVCGDGIVKEGFLFMEKIFGNLKESVEGEIEGCIFVFPDGSKIKIDGEGYIFNRHRMGQIILNKTLENGKVNLYDNCAALDIKRNEVFVISLKDKKKFSLEAKIIVDTSGFNAILRKKIKSNIIKKELKPNEYGIIFREIVKLKQKNTYGNYCWVFIDGKKIPRGYAWVFPKKNNIINTGLGFEKIVNKNPKNSYYSFFDFKDSETLNAGGGMVPVRRPLPSLVEDDFLLVGDTACQTSPITAGGIYESVIGGKTASSTIIKALEKERYDVETLWEYNIKYQKVHGKRLAIQEAIKSFIHSLSMNEQKKIISELKKLKDFEDMFLIIKFLISSVTNPFLLKKLMTPFKYVKEIDKLYKKYPEKKEGFEKWNEKVNMVFDRIYNDFNSV